MLSAPVKKRIAKNKKDRRHPKKMIAALRNQYFILGHDDRREKSFTEFVASTRRSQAAMQEIEAIRKRHRRH